MKKQTKNKRSPAAMTAVIALTLAAAVSFLTACGGGGEPPPPPKPKAHDTWNGIPVYLNGGTAAQWNTLKDLLDSWFGSKNSTEQGKFTSAVKRININNGNEVALNGTTLAIGGKSTPAELLPVLNPIIAQLPPPNALRLAGLKTDREPSVQCAFA